MHEDLKNSQLGEFLKIRPITANLELAPYLGQKVRYRKALLTPEFIHQNGTICIDTVFDIREVQINYKNHECLMGYAPEDTFGRVLYPSEIEIVAD